MSTTADYPSPSSRSSIKSNSLNSVIYSPPLEEASLNKIYKVHLSGFTSSHKGRKWAIKDVDVEVEDKYSNFIAQVEAGRLSQKSASFLNEEIKEESISLVSFIKRMYLITLACFKYPFTQKDVIIDFDNGTVKLEDD